jgi:DNA-binding response OmpR family regulator
MSHHANTPVVFLTALATAERRAKALTSGGNDFLAKPFNLHELSVKALTLILQAQVETA